MKKKVKKADMSKFVPAKKLKVSKKAYSAMMYGLKIC